MGKKSEAWARGYEWANGKGMHATLGIESAMLRYGYEPGDNEWNDFLDGNCASVNVFAPQAPHSPAQRDLADKAGKE